MNPIPSALSIADTVKIDPKGPLPDQGDLVLRPGEVWKAGAYEGTLLRSDFRLRQHALINYLIARRIRGYALAPTAAGRQALEKKITKYSAFSLADPVVSFLSGMHTDDRVLAKAALSIARESSRREAVKLAIALLGYCGKGDPDAVAVIRLLARHEEFSFYAIVALKNILPKEEADQALAELGELLSGWGKIALMYELDYREGAVRHWALKKGCRNEIGLSYLANVCAIKGKMRDFLAQDADAPLDRDYFPGICDIFRGLLEDDPENDGIFEYPDAVDAADLFRRRLEQSPADLQEAAQDILARLTEKRIGGPKAADGSVRS